MVSASIFNRDVAVGKQRCQDMVRLCVLGCVVEGRAVESL